MIRCCRLFLVCWLLLSSSLSLFSRGAATTPEEVRALALRHQEVLRETGRVEFGEGVLPKLAFAFCDSPHIHPEEYAAALDSLMTCFYYFKGELREQMGDDALIDAMKRYFDGVCQGSVEYLQGTLLEALAEAARKAEYEPDNAETDECDEDDEDIDDEAR